MTKTKTYDYSALADALISTGAVSDLATDDNGWKRLALMLADLGESARPIFDKISASASRRAGYSPGHWGVTTRQRVQ